MPDLSIKDGRAFYTRGWQTEDERAIEESLAAHGVYITNFVKCAQPHPQNPRRKIMRASLPDIAEELAIVKPRHIVTFGALPLQIITGNAYRMRDFLQSADDGGYAPVQTRDLCGMRYSVLPCYYPLGHGNPPKAHRILMHIRTTFTE